MQVALTEARAEEEE